MAVRTEAETLDLIQAITKLGNQFHTYLTGTAAVDLGALETQIAVGDQVAENPAMTTAMVNFVTQLGTAFESWKALVAASAPALGRLGSCPNLSDLSLNIDYFGKYMVDNSKEIEKRGFVKDTASVVTGSGVGLAAMVSNDLTGDIIDFGHVEDFTLQCVRDWSDGTPSGREEFLIKGEDSGIYPWDEGGSSTDSSYNYPFCLVPTDFSKDQLRNASGGNIKVLGPGSGAGNLIRNGDMEIAISGTGTDKLNQWDITTGDTTITEESTDPINGAISLDASANFTMEQNLSQSRVKSGAFYQMGIKIERKSSATGTVTVKLMDRDAGTTHGTLTVDVSTLSNDTPVVSTHVPFFVPKSAKDLKVVVELASLAVGTITFDDVMLGQATLVNGYVIGLVDGTTQDANQDAQGRFKRGDTFVIQTTSAEGGSTQKYFANMALGRYFRSDVAATADWEDWS